MKKLDEILEEDAKKAVTAANCKTDVAKYFGFTYFNKKVFEFVDSIIDKYQLSIDHFYDRANNKNRKYKLLDKICPVCSKHFETGDGQKREKTVCSKSCSNIFFAKDRHTVDSNKKTSGSLKKYYSSIGRLSERNYTIQKCLECEKEFLRKNKKQKFCSYKCAATRNIDRFKNPDLIEKRKIKIQQSIENGTFKGWSHRNKFKQSYAEEYFEKLLNENNLFRNKDFEIEYKQGRWFVDFAFIPNKIAVEIDGKQHELPERKSSDQNKDSYLKNHGWTVFRIPWKKVNKEFYDFLNEKVKEIIVYLR